MKSFHERLLRRGQLRENALDVGAVELAQVDLHQLQVFVVALAHGQPGAAACRISLRVAAPLAVVIVQNSPL
jgi:hypothetical protein